MGAASHEVIFLQAGPRGKFIFYFHSLKRPSRQLSKKQKGKGPLFHPSLIGADADVTPRVRVKGTTGYFPLRAGGTEHKAANPKAAECFLTYQLTVKREKASRRRSLSFFVLLFGTETKRCVCAHSAGDLGHGFRLGRG